MSEEFNIELQPGDKIPSGNMQLPINFITVGEIENDDVKIYIKQDVFKQLEALASSDTSKELGSILIGDYMEAMGKIHVVISAYIEARYTDASASTLTFTHETWDDVHRQHDRLYPDRKILGWQHTHPNYGIFLSNYDMFIQENFFNMPFQVAYVIDPIQNLRGFFQWKNEKVEKLRGFYIFDDIGKPIKIEQAKIKKDSAAAPAAAKKAPIFLTAVLALLVIASGALFWLQNNQLRAQRRMQEALQQTIDEQGKKIDSQDQRLKDIQAALDAESFTSIEELIKQLDSQQSVLDDQQAVIDRLKALIPQSNGSVIALAAYTVQPGDSISKICERHQLDFRANIGLIQALNGIEDIDSIYAGQIILLPVRQGGE